MKKQHGGGGRLRLAQFPRQFRENRVGRFIGEFRVRFNAGDFHGNRRIFADGGTRAACGQRSEIMLPPEDFVDGEADSVERVDNLLDVHEGGAIFQTVRESVSLDGSRRVALFGVVNEPAWR